MDIRGFVIGFLGLVCLLFPEPLCALLQKSEENEAVCSRISRAVGTVLLVIGIFLAVVDN